MKKKILFGLLLAGFIGLVGACSGGNQEQGNIPLPPNPPEEPVDDKPDDPNWVKMDAGVLAGGKNVTASFNDVSLVKRLVTVTQGSNSGGDDPYGGGAAASNILTVPYDRSVESVRNSFDISDGKQVSISFTIPMFDENGFVNFSSSNDGGSNEHVHFYFTIIDADTGYTLSRVKFSLWSNVFYRQTQEAFVACGNSAWPSEDDNYKMSNGLVSGSATANSEFTFTFDKYNFLQTEFGENHVLLPVDTPDGSISYFFQNEIKNGLKNIAFQIHGDGGWNKDATIIINSINKTNLISKKSGSTGYFVKDYAPQLYKEEEPVNPILKGETLYVPYHASDLLLNVIERITVNGKEIDGHSYVTGTAGTHYVTYVAADIKDNRTQTISYAVEVVEPLRIKPEVILLGVEGAKYKGSPIVPDVILKNGDKTITEDNYEVIVENNINAGNAKVTIKSKGLNYSFEDIVTSFAIKPVNVDIIWDPDSFIYNGEVQTIHAFYNDIYGQLVSLKVSTDKVFLEPGTYLATASFDFVDNNYQLPENKTKQYTIPSADIKGISAKGYLGTYDGNTHSIMVDIPLGAEILYSDSETGPFVSEKPRFIEVGTYETYYKVTKGGCTPFVGKETVTITPREVSVYWENNNFVYNGETQTIYAYYIDVFNNKIPLNVTTDNEFKDVGVYVASASFMIFDVNYSLDASTVTKTYTIQKADMPAIECQNYYDVFDEEEHSIEVNIPDGFFITYSLDEISYSENKPSFKDVGVYVIYYKVTSSNYNDYYSYGTVVITPKVISISWDEDNFTFTGELQTIHASYLDAKGNEKDLNVSTNKPFKDPGSYLALASFANKDEEKNYQLPQIVTREYHIKTNPITGVVVNNVETTFDGKGHGVEVVSIPDGASIFYSLNEEGPYINDAPLFSDVGNYKVYYKVTLFGKEDYYNSAEVKITPLTVNITWAENNYKYNGETQNITATYKDVNGQDVDLLVVTDPSEFKEVGDYKATAYFANGETNYQLPDNVSKNYFMNPNSQETSVYGYTGEYDGVGHSIRVFAQEGAVITYSLSEEGPYVSDAPLFSDAGEYKVFYKVEIKGFSTKTGFETVKITPKEVNISWCEDNFKYSGETQNITASYKDVNGQDVDLLVTTDPSEFKEVGTYLATASFNHEEQNYKLPDLNTKTYEMKYGQFVVIASDYEGEYDGDSHGISVTCLTEGSTVTYSTEEAGVYSSDEIKYSNVGEYKVYYKITKEGFEDYIDFKYVIITPKLITKENVDDFDDTYYYSKSTITPTVVIKANDKTLVSGTDYDLSGDLTKSSIGNYHIAVTMKGNYSGSFILDWKIIGKSSYESSIIFDDWTYGDTPSTPSVTNNPESGDVSYFYKLANQDDSKYSEVVPTNAGNYIIKAVIEETANYQEKVMTKSFEIKKKVVSPSVTISGDTGITYDGTAKTVTVKVEGVSASDYIISYQNNVNAGTASVIVKCSNANLSFADIVKTFTINQANPVVVKDPHLNKYLDADGTNYKLAEDGEVINGHFEYSLSENGTYSTAIPTKSAAGEYPLYYKLVGANSNYASWSKGILLGQVTIFSSPMSYSNDANRYAGSPGSGNSSQYIRDNNDYYLTAKVLGADKKGSEAWAEQLKIPNTKQDKEVLDLFNILDGKEISVTFSIPAFTNEGTVMFTSVGGNNTFSFYINLVNTDNNEVIVKLKWIIENDQYGKLVHKVYASKGDGWPSETDEYLVGEIYGTALEDSEFTLYFSKTGLLKSLFGLEKTKKQIDTSNHAISNAIQSAINGGLKNIGFYINGDGGFNKEATIIVRDINGSEPIVSEKTFASDYPDVINVSSVKKNAAGAGYLEVEGKPFTLLGAQVRSDLLIHRFSNTDPAYQNMTPAMKAIETEPYFKAIKDFGLNSIQIPISWADLEPEKDFFDWSTVDAYMTLANKYDLKLELLWYSTNHCGDSCSFFVPEYIFGKQDGHAMSNNPYPIYKCNKFNEYGVNWDDGGESWDLGYRKHLVINNPGLMARESNVLTKLMEHIYEWNKIERKNPVIGFQIHNEADNLARWRVSQYDLYSSDGSHKISTSEAWSATCEAINNAGLAIKSGKYKCYTRVNTCCRYTSGDQIATEQQDLFNLAGVDIVGDDPYSGDGSKDAFVKSIQEYNKLTNSSKANYSHIAEGKGDYPRSASYILAVVANRGGYNIYDFSCPQYAIDMDQVWWEKKNYEQGVVNPINKDGTFSDKGFTPAVRSVVRMISSLGPLPSLFVNNSDFVAFNIDGENPVNGTYAYGSSSANVTFKTNSLSYGAAIQYGDYVYFASTGEGTYTISGKSTGAAAQYEKGKFVNGDWVTTSTLTNPGNIAVHAGEVYRIKIK